jgi:hypothetical protein
MLGRGARVYMAQTEFTGIGINKVLVIDVPVAWSSRCMEPTTDNDILSAHP